MNLPNKSKIVLPMLSFREFKSNWSRGRQLGHTHQLELKTRFNKI